MLGVCRCLRQTFRQISQFRTISQTSKKSRVGAANEMKDANELLIERVKKHQSLPETEATEALETLEGDDKKRLEIIKLEYEVALASGSYVPETLTNSLLWDLYTATSENRRKKLLRFHAKLQNSKRKVELRKLAVEKRLAERPPPLTREENGFVYNLNRDGETKNTIFLKILKSTMDKHYYNNTFHSKQFGSQIIFDMSFERYMRPQDITNTVEQLLECHGFNKVDVDPFYFNFCNLKEGSELYERMVKSSGSDVGKRLDDYPFDVTEKSYLDLFPKERLVYLTPNAPDMLETFDPNDVYIIGGLVDKVVTKPVTFAKAKREGIRMAKFPFDLYLKWVMGAKTITLDQAIKILLTVKNTGSWRKAFEHVPRRKRLFYDEM